MKYSIAIIGVGNIGSRHMQAALKACLEAHIYLVEPSEEARMTAKRRIDEVSDCVGKTIEFVSKTDDLPYDIDLLIVATSSNSRLCVIQEMLNNHRVKYMVLEKFLFPRMDEYELASRILLKSGVKAYVNCSRRLFEIYNTIRQKTINSKWVDMHVIGGNWGLACNGIHMLDLYSFLTNEELISESKCTIDLVERREFKCDTSELEDTVFSSKRSGYNEFFGKLVIRGSRGQLTLICHHDDAPSIISILSEKGEWVIDEARGSVIGTDESMCFSGVNSFSPLMTSQSSVLVIESLLLNGSCKLATYSESAYLHMIILEAFINKYQYLCANGVICRSA